jgi:hypothetical protein
VFDVEKEEKEEGRRMLRRLMGKKSSKEAKVREKEEVRLSLSVVCVCQTCRLFCSTVLLSIFRLHTGPPQWLGLVSSQVILSFHTHNFSSLSLFAS